MRAIKRYLAAAGAVILTSVSLVFAGLGTAEAVAPSSYNISGIDLHDGTIQKFGDTYYMYGTEYGCGFNWGVSNTHWCGFGVSTSTDMQNWSTPKLLFSPNEIDPWTGTTWVTECGSTGAGCFNPRVIQRTGWGNNDGVYILWFNSPADTFRNGANAYNVMGGDTPTAFGPVDGGAHASYHKPSLYICADDGDFSLVARPGDTPVLLCSQGSIKTEAIDRYGANGTGYGTSKTIFPGSAEGEGAYYDPATGKYVMTFSDPQCGYCNGTQAGYATTPDLVHGPWSVQADVGFGQPNNGRRTFSVNSCGGQPRTVFVVDGQPYEWIDIWTGSRNETSATVQIEALSYTPHTSVPGRPWAPEVSPFECQS